MANQVQNCPDPQIWIRFLLGDQTLDVPALTLHRDSCPYCRVTYESMKNELDEVSSRVAGVPKSQVIRLALVDPLVSPTSESTTMAAQRSSPREGDTGLTFSSPDGDIFVRAWQDIGTQSVWAQVISEDPLNFQRVLLRLLGIENDYVTDDYGRVNLGKIGWPLPKHPTAEVHRALARFSLKPSTIESNRSPLEIKSDSGDTIRVWFGSQPGARHIKVEIVELRGVDPEAPVKFALSGPQTTKLFVTRGEHPSETEVPDTEFANSISIWIYQ